MENKSVKTNKSHEARTDKSKQTTDNVPSIKNIVPTRATHPRESTCLQLTDGATMSDCRWALLVDKAVNTDTSWTGTETESGIYMSSDSVHVQERR